MLNITVGQYFKINDVQEYDTILKHLKAKNIFSNGTIDFDRLSFKQVKICLHLIKDINSKESLKELFCLAFNVNEFENRTIVEFYAALNYLVKAFKELQLRETKLLKSIDQDSFLWEQAGGKKLDAFSSLMPLVQLGEIYSTYPYDLQEKPYNEILTLLVCHKTKSEVSNKYNELKFKK